MKKKELVVYDKKYFYHNNLFATKYDYLFREVIKSRGFFYYTQHKVTDFHQTNEKIFAIVKGKKDYHVSVKYLKEDKIKVKCECPYHKDTEPYCKHVYALLFNDKMIHEKEKLINLYKTNYKKIKTIKEELKTMVIDNKKYLNSLTYSWGFDLQKFYDDILKKEKDNFDEKNDYGLVGIVQNSYYYLNSIIEEYNIIIDRIEEGKKEIQKRKEKKDVVSYSFTIDGSAIFKTLDEKLANVDITVLEKVKQEQIKDGESTEIVDKAIYERKRRDELIKKEQNKYEEANKKGRKKQRRAAFFEFLSGLFDGSSISRSSRDTNYLMPWEQDLVHKGKYEPYNFEEEEKEEDDYYYEDD